MELKRSREEKKTYCLGIKLDHFQKFGERK
jgi:hypothetical protein